jgi:hypothetical protein
MSKFTVWTIGIYALIITGVAGYELAEIQKLKWVISLLLAGSSN